jgi:two-component system, NarL family, sensor histidine kinase UhpB
MGKRAMPLRMRLIASIALVLLASLGCGSVLVAWRAAGSVQTELRAALDVGTKTVRNGVDELTRADDRTHELRRLVATFDGNRHVRAMLLDAQDQAVAVSSLYVPTQAVPGWFRRVIAGDTGTVRLALPQGKDGIAAIVLQADPVNEIGEVWAESRDAVLLQAGFAVLSAVLICTIISRALRPIETLSAAFLQVGAGNYHGRVPERGPPEMARLASGFNLMSQRLATIAEQNQRLNERLVTLQAEERADLARDLHDEVGPLLFAVDMTAATIEHFAGSGRGADIPAQVRLIHDAVGRMQRHVRAILGRLRPIQAIGLAVAVDRLVAFWRSRRPDIDFTVAVAIDDDRIGDDVKETIYRVVQEGVSNAIRHGKPARVEIALRSDSPGGISVEVADDGIGMAAEGMIHRDPAQFGLTGMRERVMAMTGSLSLQHGRNGSGLTLVARLPCADLPQSTQLDEPE